MKDERTEMPGLEESVEDAEASAEVSAEDTEAILSRRAFLIQSGLASAGVVAAGCGPKADPQPCLSVAPVREPDAAVSRPCLTARPSQDAEAARPCLSIARPRDAGTPRPCLKVKPQPQPCLSKPAPGSPKPKPRVCLSVPAPKTK